MRWKLQMGTRVYHGIKLMSGCLEREIEDPRGDTVSYLAEKLGELACYLDKVPAAELVASKVILTLVLAPMIPVTSSPDLWQLGELPFPVTIASPENTQPSGDSSPSATASVPTGKTRRPSRSSAKARRTP